MPTAIKKSNGDRSRQTLIALINRSKAPIAVYYEQCYFKTVCNDESKLIGWFGPGTTIEDMKYEADIGGKLIRKKVANIADKLSGILRKEKNPQVEAILKAAIKKLDALAK